ncbi:hypothetical protein SAMN04488103_10678 [Gemmobacter aquatilis]|uniref:Uncharacterized protein n=1 Tax=Gemmobacter aquatilis TaxID=933059 RepID=A0A1H8HYS2_9RHOB|nr:hypothetical protein [Gemmobacter aquatilis]SEN61262.1 hypothetical protein SAMN04488103_10678 [Gemmobacter aquatilis]
MRSTALKKYQKLESSGLWREAPELQRREVVVAFGEASLTLSDPRTETALSHWSLPAVERINPGELPALYAPGRQALETLELEDPTMIAALETVRSAVASERPKPGRLRGQLLLGGTLLVVLLAAAFLPGALIEHTATMVPAAMRQNIGQVALNDLSRVTGAPCADPSGQAALDRLAIRLFGEDPPQLRVLPDGAALAMHLPGRIITLNRSLIEQENGPEVASGFALAEAARAAASDPLVPLLRHAGLRATFTLLTTGQLDPAAIEGYGAELLLQRPLTLAAEPLLDQFEAAGVPATPYARALDPTGEATLALIEADPFAKGTPGPILADGDWISLQAICAE